MPPIIIMYTSVSTVKAPGSTFYLGKEVIRHLYLLFFLHGSLSCLYILFLQDSEIQHIMHTPTILVLPQDCKLTHIRCYDCNPLYMDLGLN